MKKKNNKKKRKAMRIPRRKNRPIRWCHLATSSEKREWSPGNPSFPHSLTFLLPLSLLRFSSSSTKPGCSSRRWAPWSSVISIHDYIDLFLVFSHSVTLLFFSIFSSSSFLFSDEASAPPSCATSAPPPPPPSPWRPRVTMPCTSVTEEAYHLSWWLLLLRCHFGS